MKYSKKEHGEIIGGKLKNDITLINHYGHYVIPADTIVEVHDIIEDGDEYLPLSFSKDYNYKGEMKRKLFMIDYSNLPCGFMTEKQYHKYGVDSLSDIVSVSLELYMNNVKPNII